ncbi:putative RNA-directed DNA polymerase, eukaryota, reverse transcriptase zinc-binding domain protein [Tanacetum coccineum]
MSPFLFILAMEGLHALMCKAETIGLFKGASIGSDNLCISHLMYVDDVIFFGDWSSVNAHNLISILRCFYLISGLKINVQKSNVLGVGVTDEEVSHKAHIYRFSGSGLSFPLKYLVYTVGCGRLSLIKSVLGNLPTYYMSIYMMPASIRNKLESMRKTYSLRGDFEEKKIFDNQSIERDRLIGIGFVLDFVEFISFTFSDKEMILVIEAEFSSMCLLEIPQRRASDLESKRVGRRKWTNRRIRVPAFIRSCRIEEELTWVKTFGKEVEEYVTKLIAKDGTVTRFGGRFPHFIEEGEEKKPKPDNLYGFVDLMENDSGLDLTYAPSTITTQKPTEHDVDLLFKAMYDDYISGQPSAAPRTSPANQVPQTPTTSKQQ